MNFSFPKELDRRKNYVLFISPENYFGTNGYKLYVGSLLEIYWIIETPDLDSMYIRFQPLFGNHSRRILFLPVRNNKREMEATNDNAYADRIVNVFNKSKEYYD